MNQPATCPAPWARRCLLSATVLLASQGLLAAPAPTPAPALPASAAETGTALKPARASEAWVFDPQRLPASVRLHYRVASNQFPYRLSGELLWRHDRQHYQAQLSFGAFGLSRTQTSSGLIEADGLAPERFLDQARSAASARFDRAQGKISFSNHAPDLPLQPGAQDRLSVLVQIGALAASAPGRFQSGVALSFQTVGASGGEPWRFTVEKSETLNLPDGPQPTWKLARQPREAGDQRVEVWLAPALGYLPARIRITEANGDTIDQVWQSSSAAGPAD